MTACRKILFYVFLVLYLILCPLTILYALGYLVEPGTETGLVKTGLIYLSSAPPGATVTIGKKRYPQKTPAVLRNLLPGKYDVTLTLKGHELWSRRLAVEAEKATACENVLLLPAGLEPAQLLPRSFKEILPVPGNAFFILKDGSRLGDYFVYDWRNDKIRVLLPPDSIYSDSTVTVMQGIADNPCLFVRVETPARLPFQAGEKKYLWMQIGKDEIDLQDISYLFLEAPERVRWPANEKKILYALRSGYLDRLQVASKSLFPQFLTDVRGFGTAGGKVYALYSDGTLVKSDDDGKNPEVVPLNPSLSAFLSNTPGFLELRIFRDEIFFQGEKGELFTNSRPYELVPEGLRGLEIFEPKGKGLIWTDQSIGMLDFSSFTGGKGVERSREPLWFYKQGRNVEQAFWVFDASHVLFKESGRAVLLEILPDGSAVAVNTFEVSRKSPLLYLEEAGKVYFLEKGSERLMSLELIPRSQIPFLPLRNRPMEEN